VIFFLENTGWNLRGNFELIIELFFKFFEFYPQKEEIHIHIHTRALTSKVGELFKGYPLPKDFPSQGYLFISI
jgi:hypothetical protein